MPPRLIADRSQWHAGPGMLHIEDQFLFTDAPTCGGAGATGAGERGAPATTDALVLECIERYMQRTIKHLFFATVMGLGCQCLPPHICLFLFL